MPKLVKLVGPSTTLNIEVFPVLCMTSSMPGSMYDELYAEVLLDAGLSLLSSP